MARNQPLNPDNIYRVCRLRANLSSQGAAAIALSAEGEAISEGSLKDYESDRRVPSPEAVIKMAKVYNTPELEYLHCSTKCPLGEKTVEVAPTLGSEDVYRTYFQLVGAFDQIGRIQRSLHNVIADERLQIDEIAAMEEIQEVLDSIARASAEIGVWVEKQKARLES